jgi:hypothetical protein
VQSTKDTFVEQIVRLDAFSQGCSVLGFFSNLIISCGCEKHCTMVNHPGGRPMKRKPKPETNYVPAYRGASELAPPPESKDIHAVPSKLRKIMQLKSLINEGAVARANGQAQQQGRRGSEKKSANGAKKSDSAKNVKHPGVKGTQEMSFGKYSESNPEIADQPEEKKKSSFASKWKKGEEELKRLTEKIDKREKTGVRRAVSDRRKSFLNDKKKKRKGRIADADADLIPAMNQYEKVEFGDIVQAPPKLSFPRKAAEVKDKNRVQGDQSVMWEKMRVQAIEAYRQRKESSSLGGKQLRVLNFGDTGKENVMD